MVPAESGFFGKDLLHYFQVLIFATRSKRDFLKRLAKKFPSFDNVSHCGITYLYIFILQWFYLSSQIVLYTVTD